ncbi:uncharacterized protein SETTUDRAFT_35466 [Exserohilum turcica Et28A]|uniref:Uncharacterized protein n=1 Tax=Exserohilum turcicum (strain 28A) TaxID=671987 RepID=R0JZP4_EXST2|nr:uncharacterized protein SETTUDRAFT_35466 [Exserohilum turcica Et28A]EOA81637.1 hypothetical protein SETTUDRAFT_35466 [Exserohilum turcica Et28A]
MSPAWRIASPYCLALAPHINTPDPVWYVGCKTLDGEDKQFYAQTYFDINYPGLAQWTKSFPNAARSCFVTFGQNLSYFACAPGRGSIWAGIHPEFENKLRTSHDTPVCVSLGVQNAWFAMYPDRRLTWNFYGHYETLNKILMEAAPGAITYLAISPYHKDHFFVAFHDGSVKYNFQGGPPQWTSLMNEVFALWDAQRAQQQVNILPSFQPPVPQYTHAHAQKPQGQVHLQPQIVHIAGTPPSKMAFHGSNPPAPGAGQILTQQPLQNTVRNASLPSKAPYHSISQMPVELPGDMVPPPSRPVTVQLADHPAKRQSFLSKLF